MCGGYAVHNLKQTLIFGQVLNQREDSMQKTILFLLLVAVLLTACGAQPTIQETASITDALQPNATQPVEAVTAAQTDAPGVMVAPTITSAPAVTDPPVVTEAPTAELPATGGEVVYRIVPGESQLQYEVGETFLDQNNRFNVAVGVTPQVEGEIRLNLAAPQNSTIGTITADISQFTSDSGRRDNALRGRYLQSSTYPTVTFVPTQIEGLPDSYQPGQDLSLKITGDLTIRDVTRPVTFDATVRADPGQVSGQAVTTILMSDFGFGPISIGGMLNTEDEAKVTLTFVARP
jgi:polyisoprenoid-binding protein YceI